MGAALPLYNAYLQGGAIGPWVWPWIAGFSALSLAGGIASGLSDEESDRVGGKRTVASAYGNVAARRLSEACVLLGAGIWVAGSFWSQRSRCRFSSRTSQSTSVSHRFRQD